MPPNMKKKKGTSVDVAQLMGCFPSMYEIPGFNPQPHIKVDMVAHHPCNKTTQEVEAGDQRVNGILAYIGKKRPGLFREKIDRPT